MQDPGNSPLFDNREPTSLGLKSELKALSGVLLLPLQISKEAYIPKMI